MKLPPLQPQMVPGASTRRAFQIITGRVLLALPFSLPHRTEQYASHMAGQSAFRIASNESVTERGIIASKHRLLK